MIRFVCAALVTAGLISCRTTSALSDARSYLDVAPAPHPALAASPPCPEAADMLAAFHGGRLKGPLAQVEARANDVLTRCPLAWEAHEVAGFVARLEDHDDAASVHFMAAAADLRARDARFFLAEMQDEPLPVHLDRAELLFLADVAAHHPDPAVRADALVRKISVESRYAEARPEERRGAGIIESWQVVGAFDNDQGKGFLTSYPPEEGVDLDEEMKGLVVPVHWREVEKLHRTGSVPLDDIISPENESVAYLATWLTAKQARNGALMVSTDAPFRVFLNGRLVGEEQRVDAFGDDAFRVPVELAAGGNQLLIKSANERGSWRFRARLVDDHGAPMAGVVVTDTPVRFARDKRAPEPRAFVEPSGEGSGPRATLIDTRSLSRAGVVRDALESARRYAEESKDSPLAVLLVSGLLKRNQEAGKAIDLLNKTIGDDAQAPAALLIERARFYESKRRWDAAQDDLRKVRKRDPATRNALDLLASIYARRHWEIDCCRTLDEGLKLWPDVPFLVRNDADCLDGRGYRSEARAMYLRTWALQPGWSSPAWRLSLFAQDAGDLDEARRWLERYAAIEDTSPGSQILLADLARLAHDPERAKAYLAQARHIDPDGATSFSRLGDLAYEAGDRTTAIARWREALTRNPKDGDLSVHVEFAADEGFGDLQKYAPSDKDIKAAILASLDKPAAPGSNIVRIIDHQVNEVNADGSSRAIVTLVQQAVNQRGRDQLISFSVPSRFTRILDAHSITPKGETQEASSITNGKIRFRSLEVGSITVVQYLTHTPPGSFLPNHYVATFWFSGMQVDVRDSTWVAITPKDRPLFRDIQGQVKESVADAGDKRVYTWRATDVPPLLPEPGMPPAVDFLRRVSVSTLDGWDEYVRWEQALLKDAFRSNPEVDALAKRLLDGAGGPRDKINRLFRYVSKEIRYTQEYETTIAGVKPHACPVVLERGYGDCKDKAVLLILLLKKAGVAADFAILRTTDAGKVVKSVPNQQFNHAIVYVREQPGIDEGFFIDPTTDALDLGNLRRDDQGAVSLVLDPDSGKWHFADIPYQAPELEYSRAAVKLDVDRGLAHVDILSRGDGASRQRRAVRDAETAKKLEQGWASLLWPGTTLKTGSVDTSEDLTKPFALDMDVDISGAVHDDDDGARIDVPDISRMSGLTRLAARQLPLRLGVPSTESVDVTFALPAGRKVLRTPPDYHVVHACFTADRTTTTSATEVHVKQSVVKTCPMIEPADYAAFREKALEVVNHEHDPLVLSKPR